MASADATPGPGLARGLLFALFAGLGAVPFMLGLAGLLYPEVSLGVYMLGLTVVHVVVLAPTWRRALPAALLAAGLCFVLALCAPGLATATLGTLVVLGITRSALLYPRPLVRALAFEIALALPAAAAVVLVHDDSLLGNAVAVWSFWLVQSAFALLPGGAAAPDQAPHDAFETAAAAAEQLMQRQRPSSGRTR